MLILTSFRSTITFSEKHRFFKFHVFDIMWKHDHTRILEFTLHMYTESKELSRSNIYIYVINTINLNQFKCVIDI